MTPVFNGYSGVLWSAIYAGLGYYNSQLSAYSVSVSGAPSISQVELLSTAALQTTRNGTEAIDAYALNAAWAAEVTNLQNIQALPLVLDPTSTTLFNHRVTAYENAQVALAALIPQPPYQPAAALAGGTPIVASAGLLNFFATFDFETPPITLSASNLVANAFAVATAFQNVANAILVYQGNNLTQLYDVAQRQYTAALWVAQLLQAFTSGPFALSVTALNTWNQVVTLPAMTIVGDMFNGAPFTYQLQQQAVLRNLLITTGNSIATLILTLQQPTTDQIKLATLRQNETLMDFANRTTGNYENWTEIAALNGLYPPYVSSVTSPGIAGWGSQLIIPTPGTQASSTGNIPSYTINFLGTDLYIGPINGTMPAWTGDFQVISGYSNLAWALGRRLQTPIASLIYHNNYGSRIPGEVGQVLSNDTVGHVAAYGESALLADPRVASVVASAASVVSSQAISFNGTVQPGGFGTRRITVNEVLAA